MTTRKRNFVVEMAIRAACRVEAMERGAQEMTEHPHVPAAFINAIAKEGTKAEAIAFLQKQWNENCALRAELAEWKQTAGKLRLAITQLKLRVSPATKP